MTFSSAVIGAYSGDQGAPVPLRYRRADFSMTPLANEIFQTIYTPTDLLQPLTLLHY